MEKFFPHRKIVQTGNPVRKDILDLSGKKEEAYRYFDLKRDRKTLLVIGGSLGARTINESIRTHLGEIIRNNVQVIWQTGKSYYAINAEAAKGFEEQIKVKEFIDQMDLAYAAADVVISRAGALSVAELCVTKRPCLLVPSPNVAEDHQTKNAMALVNRNAALVVKDSEAKDKLVDAALQLLRDESLQQKLIANIAQLAKPHADDDIAEEILKMVNGE